MRKLNLQLGLIACVLTSCGRDVSSFDLDGKYSVVTLDVQSNRSLSYNMGDGGYIGRVEPEVVAVGWDSRFIIVKQNQGGDETRVRYYILDKDKDGVHRDPKESVVGPLEFSTFLSEREKLGVPKTLTFIKEFR